MASRSQHLQAKKVFHGQGCSFLCYTSTVALQSMHPLTAGTNVSISNHILNNSCCQLLHQTQNSTMRRKSESILKNFKQSQMKIIFFREQELKLRLWRELNTNIWLLLERKHTSWFSSEQLLLLQQPPNVQREPVTYLLFSGLLGRNSYFQSWFTCHVVMCLSCATLSNSNITTDKIISCLEGPPPSPGASTSSSSMCVRNQLCVCMCACVYAWERERER